MLNYSKLRNKTMAQIFKENCLKDLELGFTLIQQHIGRTVYLWCGFLKAVGLVDNLQIQ